MSKPTDKKAAARAKRPKAKAPTAEGRPLAPVLQLVPQAPYADLVESLEVLLDEARRGKLVGICVSRLYRGRVVAVDVHGECARSPVLARGTVRVLDDKLRGMVR